MVLRKLTSRPLIHPALHSAQTCAVSREIRSGADAHGDWLADMVEGTSRAPWTRLTSQRAKMCSRVIGRPTRRHKTQRDEVEAT